MNRKNFFSVVAIAVLCASCHNDTETPIKQIPTGQFTYDKEYIFTSQPTSVIAQVPGTRSLTTTINPQCTDYSVLFGQFNAQDQMFLTVTITPGLMPGEAITLDLVHSLSTGPVAHHWTLALSNGTATTIQTTVTYKFVKWITAGTGTATDVSFWKTPLGQEGVGGDKTIAGSYVLSSFPPRTLDAKITWNVTGHMSGNLVKYCD